MQTFKYEWQTLQVWGEQNIFITSSRSNNSLRKFGVTLMVDWNILTQLKESIVSDYCFNFVFNMLERLKFVWILHCMWIVVLDLLQNTSRDMC